MFINQQKNISSNKTVLGKTSVIIDKSIKRIFIIHPYNKTLWFCLKKIESSFWQNDIKQWIFKGDNDIYKKIISCLKQNNIQYSVEYKKTLIEKESNPIVIKYIEALIIKNYSLHTIGAYLPHFKHFVKTFSKSDISKLYDYQIKEYVDFETHKNNYNESQYKHLISSIKFYYEKILGRNKIYFKNNFINIDKKKIIISPKNLYTLFINIATKEKLLLILRYAYAKTEDDISTMTLESLKKLINDNKNDATLKKTSISYYNKYRPKKYVFEISDNQNYTRLEIEKQIIEALENNKLAEICKLYYLKALEQTNFQEQTRKNYVSGFLSFLKYFSFKHPQNISNQEIKNYLFYCKNDKKLSSNSIKNQITTIKFFYNKILDRHIDKTFLLSPKQEKKLPTILSANEVLQMIKNTENLKHRLIIGLLYSSGLRRSELLNLKLKDIDFERKVIIVRSGKGKKDRQTLLADNLQIIIKEYIEKYEPNEYLIEGTTGDKYSASSVAKIIKTAAEKSGITKRVTPHVLRHSFATHLLENTVDIRYIQELLGHSSIKTTMRYTHVANTKIRQIISPFDNLDIKNNENKPP